jgi:hypothetical protein
MIGYTANFYGAEKRPYICKVFTANSGETFHTALNFGNEEERKDVSAELIYEHMDNILRYIDDKIEAMRVIPLEEFEVKHPWAIIGWEEAEWGKNEITLWWEYIFYENYEERALAHLAHMQEEAEHASVVITHIEKEEYGQARASYDSLSKDAKTLVYNYQALLDAEAVSSQEGDSE